MQITLNNAIIQTNAKHIYELDLPQGTLVAIHNSNLCDLRKKLKDGDVITTRTINEKGGFFTYRQTLILILIDAFNRLFPDKTLKISRNINKTTFCEVESETPFAEQEIASLKAFMQKTIDSNLSIFKHKMTIEQLHEKNSNYKAANYFADSSYSYSKLLNIYQICDDGVLCYMFDKLAISTGVIFSFDIKYRDGGFILLYPNHLTNHQIKPISTSSNLIKSMSEYDIWSEILGINMVGDLNKVVLSKSAKDMIHVQESLQENKISELARAIKLEQPYKKIVLITGPSSSGKTTFANKLRANLMVQRLIPVTISLDDYYYDVVDVPLDANGNRRIEDPEALDCDLFNRQITSLLAGDEVSLPIFNFKTGKREPFGKKMCLEENQVIIVEGIHAHNQTLTHSIKTKNKYRIYLSALTDLNIDSYNPVSPTDIRLLRRIVRDYYHRNTNASGTLHMWPNVQDGEIRNIFPYEEYADIIFNSSVIYEVPALKPYAERILAEVEQIDTHYNEAQRLIALLSHFASIEENLIPSTSLIREFIGGSSF